MKAILTATEVKSMINSAVGGYAAARRALHECAWQCVAHALTYGDTTLLKLMLEQMGSRSQTRHRIAAWVRHHNADHKALMATINSKGEVSVRVGKEGDRPNFPLDQAWDEPYYDVIQTQQTKTDFELSKTALAFVKRAMENGVAESEAVAAIQAAYTKAVKAA